MPKRTRSKTPVSRKGKTDSPSPAKQKASSAASEDNGQKQGGYLLPIWATIVIAAVQYYLFQTFVVAKYVSVGQLYNTSMFHFGLGAVTLASTLMTTAPYGRHVAAAGAKKFYTFALSNARWGWVTQEAPMLLGTVPVLFSELSKMSLASVQKSPAQLLPLIPLSMSILHYTHRTLIFPFMVRTSNPMPQAVTMLACAYCTYNGALQASAFQAGKAAKAAIQMPLLVCGVAMYFLGMYINVTADYYLIALRKNKAKAKEATTANSSRYSIPYGGMFNYISCPNFFGEFVEWCGYAIAVTAVSGGFAANNNAMLAAFSFAVYTAANTFPRGYSHHKFYLTHFGEQYAKLNRRAVIPFVW